MSLGKFFNRLFVTSEKPENANMDIEGSYSPRINYIHTQTGWLPAHIQQQLDALENEGLVLNQTDNFDILTILKKRQAESPNDPPQEMRIV